MAGAPSTPSSGTGSPKREIAPTSTNRPGTTPACLSSIMSSESGMGVFINDVLPEAAAQRLREMPVPAMAGVSS